MTSPRERIGKEGLQQRRGENASPGCRQDGFVWAEAVRESGGGVRISVPEASFAVHPVHLLAACKSDGGIV